MQASAIRYYYYHFIFLIETRFIIYKNIAQTDGKFPMLNSSTHWNRWLPAPSSHGQDSNTGRPTYYVTLLSATRRKVSRASHFALFDVSFKSFARTGKLLPLISLRFC